MASEGGYPRAFGDRPAASKLQRRYGHMARTRSDFKDKIVHQLVGAIGEYYKARLAMKNGQITWVAHWATEAERLIKYALVAEVQHSVKGFKDRRKAFFEAAGEVRRDDMRYRRYAENVIKRDFQLTRLRAKLDDTDMQDFWALVYAAAEPALNVGPV
jgi:hypothetical protein